MKKRLLCIVTVLVLCAVAVCVFAGCKKKHKTHDFGEWQVTQPATCETDGIRTRSCTGCDATEQETIKATGHNYGNLIAEVPATCTTDGVKGHYECSACHKYFDAEKHELTNTTLAIPSPGHIWGSWIAEVPATCTAAGVKGHYECSACHKYFDAEKHEIADLTISTPGHTYGDWVDEIPATCIAEGTKGHYECSVCHRYFDAEGNGIDDLTLAKRHTPYLIPGHAPTCTEDGVMDTYRCSVCRQIFDADGNPITDATIPATGHHYTDFIPEVPATDTECGIPGHKDCLDCGLHFDADGNELASLVIPALSHVYSDWIDEVPATCTENGMKGHYECSHCSLVFDRDYKVIDDPVLPASHDLVFFERLEPTCTEDGHIAHYACRRCDLTFDEDKNEITGVTLSAPGHDFGEWNDGTPATCTTDGVKAHKTCRRCEGHFDADDNEIDIVIRAHHDLTFIPEVSATCTESGMAAYRHCNACGKNFDAFGAEITDLTSLTIAAREHDFGDPIEGIAASCTEGGILAHRHCQKCGKDYDEDGNELSDVLLPPTAHHATTDEIIPRLEATCLTDGYVAHFECSRCGHYYDEDGQILDTIILKKTGHIIGERNNGEEPTCTEAGVRPHYICEVCSQPFFASDATATEEDLRIPAGHDYVHYDRIEATCEEDGQEEYYLCRKCLKYFDADKDPVDNGDDLLLRRTGHTYGELIAGTEASETENGTIPHYLCGSCGQYFDEDQNPVDTIVTPKLVHNFTEWYNEEPPTCTQAGTKEHYVCSHCSGYFDRDYNEITDLTIPARHEVGELNPAGEGKCDEPDILIPYYVCVGCFSYLDENMNEISGDDIFLYADRHDYAYSPSNDWWHMLRCRDCGYERTDTHNLTYSFYTENGMHFKKGVCDECGYEALPDNYTPVSRVETVCDIYVGHNQYTDTFRVFYRDGSDDTRWAANVMSRTEFERYTALVESLGKDFTPFTETFTITCDDYTGELDITFRPFVIYGVVTAEKVYQKGYLTDLNAIYFIYDCNYTRDTGMMINEYGEILDDGGFDADFDFEANGTDTKVYTVRYRIGNTEYEVTVTYINSVAPIRLGIHQDWVLCGEWPLIVVYYSNNVFDSSPLTPAMITGGSFDPSVLGEQTFTVTTEGLTETFTVTVRGPQEVDYFYPDKQTLSVGDDLRIRVILCGRESKVIDVTPDMIAGVFDPSVAGYYEITITYDGQCWFGGITVLDPDDTRISRISMPLNGSLVWDVRDGNVVPDLRYLYIAVWRQNGERSYMKVTEEMISYDPQEVADAIENGEAFDVKISYYGKSTYVTVAPRDLSGLSVYDIAIQDAETLSYNEVMTMYGQDGDLSRYFVRLRTVAGYYFLPLSESMLFKKETDGTLSPFDFANAKNNTRYSVTLQYGGAERNNIELLVFTESDIEYSFSMLDSEYVTAGTKEEVLAQLAGRKFYLNMYVCSYSQSIGYFDFEDLILAPMDDIDFSQPGIVRLKASYKGIVNTIYLMLIPDLDGLEKTVYRTEDGILELYENGYVRFDGHAYGTYSLENEALHLYRLDFYNGEYARFFTINGDEATPFRAELLGGTSEEYYMRSLSNNYFVSIYTKNGFSMADFYDDHGYYDYTLPVSFTADGQHLFIRGIRYAIKDNYLLEPVPEGEIVYRYLETEEGEDFYIRATLNDNGVMYIYAGMPQADGTIEEYLVESFRWREKDGIVTIYYENGYDFVEGTIDENGYLVLPIS